MVFKNWFYPFYREKFGSKGYEGERCKSYDWENDLIIINEAYLERLKWYTYSNQVIPCVHMGNVQCSGRDAKSTKFKRVRLRLRLRPEKSTPTPAPTSLRPRPDKSYSIPKRAIWHCHFLHFHIDCIQTGDIAIQHTFTLTADAASREYRWFPWMCLVWQSLNFWHSHTTTAMTL